MPNRILVVCYSRGGTTFEVAKHLADALEADIERIEDVTPRNGVGGYLRSAFEAVAKGVPTIYTRRNPRDYDFVVLGSPVWAGTLASPLRSYLVTHGSKLRLAGCFAIMGGMGGHEVVRELEAACGTDSLPTCVLTEADVKRGRYREKCAPYISALRDLVAQAGARKSAPASAA
jgi:flavodoxin